MIKINGIDSESYGITFLEGTLESLMRYPALKEPIINNSRAIHGVQMDARNSKVNSQKSQVYIRLKGSTESEYLDRYDALQKLLILGKNNTGIIELSYSRYIFKLHFESCDLLRKLAPNMGTFQLTFTEPNPMDRL